MVLADGQLSDHEVYPNLQEIEGCIDNQKDVTHFECYFHIRSQNQLLATVNTNGGAPVLKILMLDSTRMEFQPLN